MKRPLHDIYDKISENAAGSAAQYFRFNVLVQNVPFRILFSTSRSRRQVGLHSVVNQAARIITIEVPMRSGHTADDLYQSAGSILSNESFSSVNEVMSAIDECYSNLDIESSSDSSSITSSSSGDGLFSITETSPYDHLFDYLGDPAWSMALLGLLVFIFFYWKLYKEANGKNRNRS